MIKLELQGIVKEIVYKGERSLKFLFNSNERDLLCTITNDNIKLADYVKENEAIKIRGQINAYTRYKDGIRFIDNVCYVNEIIMTP